MFVEVIPHWTSFSIEALTYFVGTSFRSRIQIWQLVEIPYGKKTIFGIVARIFSEENFWKNFDNSEETENVDNFSRVIPWKFARFSQWENNENNEENFLKNFPEIKEISNIVSEKPILSEYQVTMILRISLKYILTLHKALGIFLSEPILRRLQKYSFPLGENPKIFKNFLEKNEKQYDFYISKNEIISPEKILPFFKKSLIIILPDDIVLSRFEKFFEKNSCEWNDAIAFYPNDMTDTKRAQAFIDIYNKKKWNYYLNTETSSV